MTDAVDWDNDILGDDTLEDGLIELTDVVEEDLDTSENETIIELSDIVEDEPKEPESLGLEMDAQEEDDIEDDFFVEEETVSDNELGLETEGMEIDEPLLDVEPVEEDALIEEDEGVLSVAPVASAVQDGVSMEQLEEALERVIEKKFADKIETILFEVMERVIEKEIAQIKESLQKDLDQIGNG